MEWTQLLTVVGANLAMFMWSRSEARHDQAEMRSRLQSVQEKTNELINAIREDMRDFHGRLCAIEERNKGFISTEKAKK